MKIILVWGLKISQEPQRFVLPHPTGLCRAWECSAVSGNHLATWRSMSASHFPATNGNWLSSYDKAQKIIQPKPFGSIYYKYKDSPVVHYVPPIQTQLRGITKNSEINMWERAVWKLGITWLQLLSLFLLLPIPSSLPPSFLPFFPSIFLSFLPSQSSFIWKRESRDHLIYLKQNVFSKCLHKCVCVCVCV